MRVRHVAKSQPIDLAAMTNELEIDQPVEEGTWELVVAEVVQTGACVSIVSVWRGLVKGDPF